MRRQAEPWHPGFAVKLFLWLSCTAVTLAAGYVAGAVLFPKTGVGIVLTPLITGAIITLCFGRVYAVATANMIALGTFIYVLFFAEKFSLRQDFFEAIRFSLILGLLAVAGMGITIGIQHLASLLTRSLAALSGTAPMERMRNALRRFGTSVRRTITHRAAP
ncbi:MAG: hypothetical protein Q8R35_00910 [bacterium]|nr:hypothetical protein [bacterium]